MKRVRVWIAALIAVGCVAATAEAQNGGAIRQRSVAEDLQMFSQVLNQIRVNHPDSVDMHELFVSAIEGMVRAADPHSYVLTAARLSPDKERQLRDGKLHPVPLAFTYIGGAAVVVSVTPGSAAAKLDILAGDELIAIDGEPVRAESALELEVLLAGPRGSSVDLTFERRRVDGSLATLTRTVERERVEESTAVPAAFLMDDGTGYVRITTFMGERVAEDLHAALRRLEKGGMQRLIMDLRDNGGGSLDEAARIASEFLPSGAVVYTAEGRKEEISETRKVKRSFWRRERRYPIAVMVNSGTASASELVAGALQDHDRALIVGRPTFGKALLMQGFPLADGSVVMMVVGHVKTPCGRIIQRQYRNIRSRDYYRLSRAERDTVGRPSCKTTGGRTVYGGGGIHPDVVLPEPEPAPLWLARVREEDLPLRWTGGYLMAHGDRFTTPEALAADPRLAADALADFRGFAEQQGVTIPEGAEADQQLARALLGAIARVRWGEEGYYRISAVLDPEVDAARRELGNAASILAGGA